MAGLADEEVRTCVVGAAAVACRRVGTACIKVGGRAKEYSSVLVGAVRSCVVTASVREDEVGVVLGPGSAKPTTAIGRAGNAERQVSDGIFSGCGVIGLSSNPFGWRA